MHEGRLDLSNLSEPGHSTASLRVPMALIDASRTGTRVISERLPEARIRRTRFYQMFGWLSSITLVVVSCTNAPQVTPP